MALSGNKTTGAVIYTRVSTGEQAEHGTSLDSQRDVCRAKALALGLPIIAEYEDAGVSGGFLLSRPGMMAAIADLRAGRAGTMICANVSRYSRDVEHQQTLLKSVRAAGGRLVFCEMDFEDTPSGDLMFGMMGQFAQWERQTIRERTMTGQRKRAAQGRRPCSGWDPFGFHVVRKADVLRGEHPADMVGRHVVKPDEAEAVAHLFRQYASGAASLSGLARWLFTQGIPSRQGHEFWDVNCVRIVLRNPLYKGLAAFGRTRRVTDESRLTQRHPHTGEALRTATIPIPNDPSAWITWEVPALVPEDVWDAVQERLAANRRLKGGNPRRVGMLAGRLLCPVCDGTMTTARTVTRADGEKVRLMACLRHRKRQTSTGEPGCAPDSYDVAVAEAGVVDAITDAAQRREAVQAVIAAALAAYNAPPAVDAPAEAARIESALRTLAAREEAAVKAQIAGVMAGADPALYAAAFADIRAQRQAWEEKRTSLAKQTRPTAPCQSWTAADFPRILADVRRVLTDPAVPGDEKRDAIGQLVERVYPLQDGARVTFLPGVLGETVNFMLK